MARANSCAEPVQIHSLAFCVGLQRRRQVEDWKACPRTQVHNSSLRVEKVGDSELPHEFFTNRSIRMNLNAIAQGHHTKGCTVTSHIITHLHQ